MIAQEKLAGLSKKVVDLKFDAATTEGMKEIIALILEQATGEAVELPKAVTWKLGAIYMHKSSTLCFMYTADKQLVALDSGATYAGVAILDGSAQASGNSSTFVFAADNVNAYYKTKK